MNAWERICGKVEAGERISRDEGIYLLEKAELHRLGQLADRVRKKKVGDRASYVVNRYLNYSNILHSQLPVLRVRQEEAGSRHI